MIDGIFGYKNVVGYTEVLQSKIKESKVIFEDGIRIYVSKKEPLPMLRPSEILPESIEDIPTFVEEIGRVDAGVAYAEMLNNRDRHRPLVAGISVGNAAISAGTLGRLVERKNGNKPVYAPSNAHVFTDVPDEYAPIEQLILQPGKYDKGNKIDDVIGFWAWHERVFPAGETSDCKTANAVMNGLNFISEKLGRRSRFTTFVAGQNYQDFAVATLTGDLAGTFILDKTYDFPLDNHGFGARLFAGSSQRTIACKAEYQLDAGYYPVDNFPIHEFKVGDKAVKSGRTTFGTEGIVQDINARVLVNYGNFSAPYSDVIILTNMSTGGDSGSDMYHPFPSQ